MVPEGEGLRLLFTDPHEIWIAWNPSDILFPAAMATSSDMWARILWEVYLSSVWLRTLFPFLNQSSPITHDGWWFWWYK